MLHVLVILCPPLAVLFTAPPTSVAKNVGLTLFFYVPGVIHARRMVEQYTINRRYDALMRALDDHEARPATRRTPSTQAA